MKNEIFYEWVFEETESNGDIVDPLCSETLRDAMDNHCAPHNTPQIALIRHIGNNEDGEVERWYAYIENGALPERFPLGPLVPKKYHRELLIYNTTKKG